MTYPPADEPSQQRRAIVYGRANQASAHYRPLRKGRPMAEAAPAPTGRAKRAAIRRRVVLFVVALVVAIASGIAIVGIVLASPAPLAQAPHGPAQPAPEPATQPLPPTGRAAPAEIAPPSAGRSGSPESTAGPRGTTTTRPAPGEGSEPATSAAVVYQNCNKARRAGAAPLYPGDPGYSKKLDKDGNGIACDEKEKDRDKA